MEEDAQEGRREAKQRRVSPRRYKAFISYSHAADGKLAPALQAGLERFAKPWYRRRAVRVFRDKTGLAVTPELWGSIQRSLEASEYFILLASPMSAQSRWVHQEVDFWLQHRSVETLLIVMTDGVMAWDAQQNDFDWRQTDALPRLLEKRFAAEPNYLDLRWARADTDLSVRRPRFLDAIASLSATLRGMPLDDLIGEDVAHYRTTRRLLKGTIATLVVLTTASLYAAYLANQARNLAGRLEAERVAGIAAAEKAAGEQVRKAEALRAADAERQRNAAASRELATVAAGLRTRDRELGTLLAMEALQIGPTPEAERTLRDLLIRPASPTVFQGPEKSTVDRSSFSADGRRLLAVFEDGSVRIWSVASSTTPVALAAQAIGYSHSVNTHAAFSPDGSTVLTVPFEPGRRTFLDAEGKGAAARIWGAETGQLRKQLPHPYISDAAFSPDGKRVVTVGGDRRVVIWNAESGATLTALEDHEGAVVSVDFSMDGKWFITASDDDVVRIRSTEDGNTSSTIQPSGKAFLTTALLSPDSRWIVTIARPEPPRVWDWQRAPGSSIAELRAGEDPLYFAGFNPGSDLLATVGGNSAQIWQTASGRMLHNLRHEEAVMAAAFSPSGRWIVTVSVDGAAVLWDVATGKRLMEFGGYDRARTTAAFSADGSRVATGTASGQVLVYACDVCGSAAELLAVAKSRVTRSLTAEERKKYGGAGQPR